MASGGSVVDNNGLIDQITTKSYVDGAIAAAITSLQQQSAAVVFKTGGAWPTRPTGWAQVLWVGVAPGPTIGGVGGAIAGVDEWDDIT